VPSRKKNEEEQDMLKHRSWLIGLIVVAAFSILVDSVAAKPFSGKKIGYIGMDEKLSYFQSQTLALKKIADREGFEAIILDPQFDAQKYMDQVETLITQKVDGIFLSVWEPGLGAGAVKRIQQAGVNVVVLHTRTAESVSVHTITADNYKAGLLAGAEAAKMWKKANPGRLPVIGILTNTDAPENVKRTGGAVDAFKKVYPKVSVAKTLDAGYALEKALAACEDMLSSNPEVNVIFTAHDTQAMGALAGLRSAGRGTWPDAIITSVDASRQSSGEILDPNSAFRISIGNSPVTMIETAWGQIMKKMILGQKAPMFLMHDMELVNSDNINKYLDINFPVQN
jgi:ABC-type sugar transport system substrate-binding protein